MSMLLWDLQEFNTLRLTQNDCHFQDNIFKCIFLNKMIDILLKFVTKGPINNILALAQIMAWHWPDDKLLSEPMMPVYWRIYTSLGLNKLRWISEGYLIMQHPSGVTVSVQSASMLKTSIYTDD